MNELRRVLKMEEYPNVPDRDEDMERRIAEFQRDKDKAIAPRP